MEWVLSGLCLGVMGVWKGACWRGGHQGKAYGEQGFSRCRGVHQAPELRDWGEQRWVRTHRDKQIALKSEGEVVWGWSSARLWRLDLTSQAVAAKKRTAISRSVFHKDSLTVTWGGRERSQQSGWVESTCRKGCQRPFGDIDLAGLGEGGR